MSRAFTPKVITANRLLEGDAVWLTEDDQWATDIAQAELIEDEAHATIRLLDGEAQSGVVVGVYLVDVKAGADGPIPIHFREEFRTRGPSNYAHGKQVEA
jgi:hypothetical protein